MLQNTFNIFVEVNIFINISFASLIFKISGVNKYICEFSQHINNAD